jgi:hypothetical protein
MKMWKKIVALALGVMLMGTAVGAVAEEPAGDLVMNPLVEDVAEETKDVKDEIMAHLTEKLQHMGDALMNMDFDVDIAMSVMGESNPIKIKAEINAVSSGVDKVQLFGTAEMKSKDEEQNIPIDAYMIKNEDGAYTMYMRADEGWTKQSIDAGETMDSLNQAIETINQNGAFVIVNEPEQQDDGLHFQAYLDLGKILASVGEEGMDELNEATSTMLPGMDVAEMLVGIEPIDIKIVCDENYDPTAIFVDAKAAVQTLVDVVVNGIVNQMLASMSEASEEETADAEEMDMSQFMSITINTLVWNLNKIQTLPAGSVVIELPEEAKNAVETSAVMPSASDDYESTEPYDAD